MCAARETGGDVEISSKPGEGTRVSAVFMAGHIDMKPVGDMSKTVEALVVGYPEVRFVFRFVSGGEEETFDTGARGSADGS